MGGGVGGGGGGQIFVWWDFFIFAALPCVLEYLSKGMHLAQ